MKCFKCKGNVIGYYDIPCCGCGLIEKVCITCYVISPYFQTLSGKKKCYECESCKREKKLEKLLQ